MGEPQRTFEFLVLGPVLTVRADAPVDLGGPRQRAVLAVLLAEGGEPVSASALIDRVWGDAAPRNSSGALQAYVSHLRRRLEPDRTARSGGSLIVNTPAGYALQVDPEAVDARRFERMVAAAVAHPEARRRADELTRALALWRGVPYGEFAGQAWADAEAGRLGEIRSSAQELLLAARVDSGETGLLVGELESAAAAEPLREERWRLLALTLYRANRQADALAALRRARAILADELGVDPGPALRELEAEILAHAPTLLVPDPKPAAVDLGPARAALSADLVDRTTEMRLIEQALADLTSGEGGLIVIRGPAGIGKTRLLNELKQRAKALVLTARGSELEREFGFGVVRQLAEPMMADHVLREQLLTRAAASAAHVFGHAPPPSGMGGDSPYAVLHGLYWLAVNLSATRPVVFAVDDLQWCDQESLQFFGYLARRLEGLPVLLVATLRTGEAPQQAHLVADLEHEATLTLQPDPLTRNGVASLVRQRLGDNSHASFIAACHRTTGGNPLLLRQLLRALESDRVRPDAAHADTVNAIGSRAVASLVLMRLGRLHPDAKTVARAVAILGDGAELPAVSRLTGLAEDATAAAVAALARTEMLRDEYPLGFVHPLVHDAVYTDIPVGERELTHLRAAKVLEDVGAPVEKIASHLMHVPARGDEWVVEVLIDAGTAARERGASTGAMLQLRRALAESPTSTRRLEILKVLGAIEALSDGAAAVGHLSEAYELDTDPVDRAGVAQLLSQVLIFAGDEGSPVAFAERAVAALEPDQVDQRQGLLAVWRLAAYLHGLDPQRWGPPTEITGTGLGARMLASALAWEACIAGTDRKLATDLARFALADGALVRQDAGLFWAVAANTLELAEEDVGSFWDDALAAAHERGSLFTALTTHLWYGHTAMRRGDLHEAKARFESSLEQSNQWGAPIGDAFSQAMLLWALLDLGDAPAARVLLESLAPARVGDGGRLLVEAEAELLLAEGRPQDALNCARRAAEMCPYLINPAWRSTQSILARAYAALGQDELARECAETELAISLEWGTPRLVGRAQLVAGEVTGQLELLREAVATLSGTSAMFDLARAQRALARRLPEGEERNELLRNAFERASRCGADGLRNDIAALLTSSGCSLPTDCSATLTPTERKIATMTAAGSDERDIAQALFMTPRTVRQTIESIRDRLGVATDEQLASALSA